MDINQISGEIVDAAIKVHKALGPGLLESAYQKCLAFELRKRGLEVEMEVALPVVYDSIRIDAGFRIDLLVAGSVIVETKAVEKLLPIHDAQIITYLKLSGIKLGLLINFNVTRLLDGLKRMANKL